jgi:hypothetical protein
LVDLAAEKQGDRAIVVFIIGVVMNEFVQAWIDDQDPGPLEHPGQKRYSKSSCLLVIETGARRQPKWLA